MVPAPTCAPYDPLGVGAESKREEVTQADSVRAKKLPGAEIL